MGSFSEDAFTKCDIDNENGESSLCNFSPINTTLGYKRIDRLQVLGEDWAVFVVFFVFVIFIGFISAFRNRGSLSGFFLTARSANWILIGTSMFASNIGSSHFIALAGSAATYGLSAAVYELNALFILPLLGWVYAPVYMASNVSTMPEYLRARFGGRRIQIYIACNALFLYIFTKISSDLYAGKLYLKEALGISEYLSIILLLFVAALLTIIGGMTAVLWTNFLQLLVVLVGAFYLMIKVLYSQEIDGVENLFIQFIESKFNTTLSKLSFPDRSEAEFEAIEECSYPPEPGSALHLIQPPDDVENAPWPGVLFGVTILSLWYWCSDQVVTQHMLASKNLFHAKLGCILTAMFKFLPIFVFVLPGMAARVIFHDIVACSDPLLCCCYCNNKNGCSNEAYSIFMSDSEFSRALLPPGARGLMAITVTAALVSSFTSVFNACSTIFTMDIWRLIRSKASSKELQIVGRVFIFIVCTVSCLWMVIVRSQPHLLSYMQSMTSYFSPPLAAIFMLAIFWERCNELGVFIGLMIGLFIGIVRFGLEFAYLPGPSCVEKRLLKYDLRPPALRDVHYLYFAMILFSITILVTVCISLVSKPPDLSRINGLTYWRRHEPRIMRRRKVKRRPTNNSQQKDDSHYTTPGENDDNRENNVAIEDTSDERQFYKRKSSNRSENSKWRHFVNWLCGIEVHVSDENDANMSRRPAVSELLPDCVPDAGDGDQQPPSTKCESDQTFNLVPLSSSLFEEPWMSMVSSVALVLLLTASVFFWVLLF